MATAGSGVHVDTKTDVDDPVAAVLTVPDHTKPRIVTSIAQPYRLRIADAFVERVRHHLKQS